MSTEIYNEKIAVYITKEQKRRVANLPKSVNVSEHLREALVKLLDKSGV